MEPLISRKEGKKPDGPHRTRFAGSFILPAELRKHLQMAVISIKAILRAPSCLSAFVVQPPSNLKLVYPFFWLNHLISSVKAWPL